MEYSFFFSQHFNIRWKFYLSVWVQRANLENRNTENCFDSFSVMFFFRDDVYRTAHNPRLSAYKRGEYILAWFLTQRQPQLNGYVVSVVTPGGFLPNSNGASFRRWPSNSVERMNCPLSDFISNFENLIRILLLMKTHSNRLVRYFSLISHW